MNTTIQIFIYLKRELHDRARIGLQSSRLPNRWLFPSEKETQHTPALLALKNTQDFNFLPFKEQFNPSD